MMNLAQQTMTKSTSTAQSQMSINSDFHQFVTNKVLPLVNLEAKEFWNNFEQLISDFTPKNNALLKTREQMQAAINTWHQENPNFDQEKYTAFLHQINYLHPQIDDFEISTQNVDEEISHIAGPQLVVPITNARFALNAANARWGSLYDAVYGSNLISQTSGLSQCNKYNPARGKHVIEYAKEFLDQNFPLEQGSHKDVSAYCVYFHHLLACFPDGTQIGLEKPCQFVASSNPDVEPTSIVLKNNGLHIEMIINRQGKIGKTDLAGIDDIQIESALTSIMDFEDSVAAVDAEDKILGYQNWFGLITGRLTANLNQGNHTQIRRLNCDKNFTHKNGDDYNLHGRSLLLVRNVGHLMTTDLIQTPQGNETPEGLVDAVITALIASIEIKNPSACRLPNSRTRSIYIVKPKMHGPEEVAFSCEVFDRVEEMLGLEPKTIKIGIMDEERRTSLNLKQCIYAARERVMFINTGFLDRTGDEIHTSMQAGAFVGKTALKHQAWIKAYENQNVALGLQTGFSGKAQIGKGMWAMPDDMAQMMNQKIAHPQSGANTAWVPSPTAATLHALHYHAVDVFEVQENMQKQAAESYQESLLTIPLATKAPSNQEIEEEVENNIQGILGYVSRWVGMGVGCSKVPNIDNENLMEDRATLRISSQHLANWLMHGVCTKKQVERSLEKMAAIVDKQNAGVAGYTPMTQGELKNNLAYRAAHDLIFKATTQPNGYTEPLLHQYRRQEKLNS